MLARYIGYFPSQKVCFERSPQSLLLPYLCAMQVIPPPSFLRTVSVAMLVPPAICQESPRERERDYDGRVTSLATPKENCLCPISHLSRQPLVQKHNNMSSINALFCVHMLLTANLQSPTTPNTSYVSPAFLARAYPEIVAAARNISPLLFLGGRHSIHAPCPLPIFTQHDDTGLA